jgi:hypothetical protein
LPPRIAEHRAPLADAAVASEQDRTPFVPAADQLEKEVRGIGFKGQVTELVNDQELWLGEMREPLLEPAFGMALGELCNDRRGRNELDRMPGQDRFAPQRHRKWDRHNTRGFSLPNRSRHACSTSLRGISRHEA